jgi:TonB family protein
MKLDTPAYSRAPVVFVLLVLQFCWHCSYQGSKSSGAPDYSAEKLGTLEIWDEPPEPIGGFEEIQKSLYYPEFARKEGVQGTVMMNAVINENGEVEEVKIIQSLESRCDEEAIRAVKSVPWKPARQKGVPVRAMISIPITFRWQKVYEN